MKTPELMNPGRVFLEISQNRLSAFNGTVGLDLPLEYAADGRLTETCKNALVNQLRGLLQRKSWQPRPLAFCAISARGVSLRRLSLPAGSAEELQRLLPLQIESEFPIGPDQLAWGWQRLAKGEASMLNGKQELLIAAVKKEAVEDYANVLMACGATPVFTLAALARSYVCPQPPGPYALLALSDNGSELITIEKGVPISVRVLNWGTNSLAAAVAQGADWNARTALLSSGGLQASFGGAPTAAIGEAHLDPVESLARLINGQNVGQRIYLLRPPRPVADFDLGARLEERLGNAVQCQVIDLAHGQGRTPAILGLQMAVERENGALPLVLRAKQANGKARIDREVVLKWGVLAGGLLLLALLLPYAEALTLKSHLANKLTAIKSDQGRLATMDRELDFLQYLQENEPPYLDALLVLAKAAPPGTHFDSVSMNRRGELSLRGSLRDGQQVADLRTKLIGSGFFDAVGIEEQAPTPDRQKVNVRLSAQWKPLGVRKAPASEPSQPSTGSKGSTGDKPGTPSSKSTLESPVTPLLIRSTKS